jgi:hypothetical protein
MSPGKRVFPGVLTVLSAAVVLSAAAAEVPPAASDELRPPSGISVRNVVDAFDYFSNSWALIGLKDYPEGTRISPDGEFLLAGGAACRILFGESLIPLDGRIRRILEKGRLPVVRCDFVLDGTVEYTVEAFACPLPASGREGYDFPASANFLNLVRVVMRNATTTAHRAAVGLEGRAWGQVSARALSADGTWALHAGDRLFATLGAGPGARIDSDKTGIFRIQTTLPPGGTASAVLCLPHESLQDPEDQTSPDLARLDFDAWKRRTLDFWEGVLARGAALEVPEEKVLDSYLASLVYQFIGRDKGELHAGEGFYDEIYLRDGAYQAVSLAQAGYLDEARRSLEFFLLRQRENGQFVSQKGQLDANGYAVWALVEFGLLSGDRAWLERMDPSIARAVSFIRNARRAETDPASRFYGLMPKAPADGENLWSGNDHIVGYDWWNLRAVQSAVEAARALGKDGEAAAREAEFEDYRTAVLRALGRTGLPYIPPSYEKEGTHWGNLEAVFPTPLIDPMDHRLTATLDFVRDSFGRGEGGRPGFIEGVMQWTPATNAIHPYMSLFVTNSHIVRGEQEKAVDGLYAFLLHSTSTQGFPEGVYYRKREAWSGTIPHLWAAALYVTTLRNMIVREEDGDLHLLSAVPSGWLEPGKRIVFENAPTRFGRISLAVEAGKGKLVVRFTRPERADPERVLLHLPPDLEITEIGRCGRGVKVRGAREVFIPGPSLAEENDLEIAVRRVSGVRHPDFSSKVAEYLAGSR